MTTECVRSGQFTLNGVDLEYRVFRDDLDPYRIEFYLDDEFLGDLPMSSEDYEFIDEIWMDDSVYSAAEEGLLPDVGRVCGIECIYGGI